MRDYSVITIANWFIDKANDEDIRLNQMKLMMLLYIAQGFEIVKSGKVLFTEEIEAWKYGPIIPLVTERLLGFGLDTIIKTNLSAECPSKVEVSTNEILLSVWATAKNYTGIQLCNWSHNEDGPWYQIWERDGGKKVGNRKIPPFLMYKYFKKFITKGKSLSITKGRKL